MTRARIRDIGVKIGTFEPGRYNAITDVEGVRVGYATRVSDEPAITRTGVTVVTARDGAIGNDYAFAGFHSFNGCGEMTGIHWLEETGYLSSAIALTNTHQVGMARDALSEYSFLHGEVGPFFLPVATETYDGWLNDRGGPPLTRLDVFEAMDGAKPGPVEEGSVGGGTGMICFEFKGGTGTSSRIVPTKSGAFTVGVLVQSNFGDRAQLRVDGVPVGREITTEIVPSAWSEPQSMGSIVIIVATDAPLLPMQCKKLAQRATVGLGRAGGAGHNMSGDLFLAFATGHHIPARADGPFALGEMIPHNHLNPMFDAVADAVEESILNALCAADTTTGPHGRVARDLPLDLLREVMKKYHRV